jgi:hypothetical protein
MLRYAFGIGRIGFVGGVIGSIVWASSLWIFSETLLPLDRALMTILAFTFGGSAIGLLEAWREIRCRQKYSDQQSKGPGSN